MAAKELSPAIHGGHEAWRYTLISGVIPALPMIVIRPFPPESPAWEHKRLAGQLRGPSIAELFGPGLLKMTVVTTLMFAANYRIAFGAIRQLPQILSGHVQIVADGKTAAEKVAEASKEPPSEGRRKQIAANSRDETVAKVTI